MTVARAAQVLEGFAESSRLGTVQNARHDDERTVRERLPVDCIPFSNAINLWIRLFVQKCNFCLTFGRLLMDFDSDGIHPSEPMNNPCKEPLGLAWPKEAFPLVKILATRCAISRLQTCHVIRHRRIADIYYQCDSARSSPNGASLVVLSKLP